MANKELGVIRKWMKDNMEEITSTVVKAWQADTEQFEYAEQAWEQFSNDCSEVSDLLDKLHDLQDAFENCSYRRDWNTGEFSPESEAISDEIDELENELEYGWKTVFEKEYIALAEKLDDVLYDYMTVE